MDEYMSTLTPPKEVIDVLQTNIGDETFKLAYDELLKYEGNVRGTVKNLLMVNEKFLDEVKELTKELGKIKTEKDNVESLLEAANVKLDARPFLELTERDVIPPYLKNAKYFDPIEKWYISIRYELTLGAKIICARLNQNYEDVWKVSQLLVRMFRGLSSTIAHSDAPNRVQFSEKEWKELFQFTDIKAEVDQKRIKQALQPITVDQLGQVSLSGHFVLHVSGIGLNLENNTEYDETNMIKDKCSTYAVKMRNFYYPVNAQGNFKNEVVFQVDEEDDKIIEALEAELRDSLKEEFKNTIKIRKMKIFSRKSSFKYGTKRSNQSSSSDHNSLKRQRHEANFEQSHSSSRYSSDSVHSQPHNSNFSRRRPYKQNYYNSNRYKYTDGNPYYYRY